MHPLNMFMYSILLSVPLFNASHLKNFNFPNYYHKYNSLLPQNYQASLYAMSYIALVKC